MGNLKSWLEGKFTLLTVLFHALMLVITTVTISNYQDLFLGSVLVLMLVYFAVMLTLYRGRVIAKGPVIAYMICTLVQFVMLDRIVPEVSLGAVDMGSSLAVLFYILLLIASCVVLGSVNGFKLAMAKSRK